jgi:inner membrane protein
MDNATHTLFALTLARTPLGRAGRGAKAALLIASNVPDIDIVAVARGGISYLAWHRGPTHGPLGIVGLGVMTAGLVWVGQRTLDRRAPGKAIARASEDEGHASFGMLVVVSLIGVLLHVLMDFPTSYGTRLLSPFDWHWFAVDWMPIVDIYLLSALAAGLMFGRVSAASSRRNAAIVFALMAAYYGIRGVAHHEAMALAPRLFGPLLPQRCDAQPSTAPLVASWPRATTPHPFAESGNRCLVEMAALPTFISPFRWRVVVQLSNAYEIHDVNLLDERFRSPGGDTEGIRRLTVRFPNQWTPQVARAADTRLGRVFLDFSRFPAARWVVEDKTGITTVRWTDMRFAGGVLTLEQPVRRPDPFTAVVRIGPDGRILDERLGR